MQAQLIFVFLAHAFVIIAAHAQESIDAGCERYASRIGIYAGCDAREFVEPIAPVSDIGLEAALMKRIQSTAPGDQVNDNVPRTEDALESPLG